MKQFNSNSVFGYPQHERAKKNQRRAKEGRVLLADAIAPLFERLEDRTLMSFAGDLDSSFGSSGVVTTNITSNNDEAVALQFRSADGTVLAVGNSSAGNGTIDLARYTSSGSLDTTFGGGSGTVAYTTPAGISASGVAIDSSGNIFVVGSTTTPGNSSDFAIVKFTPAGNVVSGFGTSGVVTVDFNHKADGASAVAIDPSTGELAVAGFGTITGSTNRQEFALAQINPATGLTDSKVLTPFGTVGNDAAKALTVQTIGATNYFVATGYATNASGNTDIAVARYTSAGVLDTGFGGSGIAQKDLTVGSNDLATSVGIESDGSVVVAGSSAGNAAVASFTADGSYHASWSSTSGAGFAQANGLAIQYNGKIVITGYNTTGTNTSIEVGRLNINLSADSTFGTGGFVTTAYTDGSNNPVDAQGNAVVVALGKITVAGTASIGNPANPEVFTVARYQLNNAPTLGSTTGQLNSINEDVDLTSNSGTTVATLVGATQLNTADADGDIVGMAVTGFADNTTGTWQYSIDNGTNWSAIPATVSAHAGLLLAPADLVRFLPDANFNTGNSRPQPTLNVVAWDQTVGVHGNSFDTAPSPDNQLAGFSTNSATLSLIVNAVNDAPTVSAPTPQTVLVNTASAIYGISVADIDANDTVGATLTVTLSVGSGKLTLSNSVSGGVTVVSGNGSNTVTATGSIDQLNTTFADAAGLIYDSTGASNTTLHISADDSGNTGAGGSQTGSADVSISVSANAAQVWVDGNWQIVTDVGSSGLSQGDTVQQGSDPTHTYGVDAFSTIQGGVNGVGSGGIVSVYSGTYSENVAVNKSVDLQGAESGVDPRSTGTTARSGGETIVQPASDNASNGNVFTVTSDGVTVDGFDIRGSTGAAGGVSVNGVSVHAARGIANGVDGTGTWSAISGLTVENDIVQDFGRAGVELFNAGLAATGSNSITQNVIDNAQGYNTSSSSSLSSSSRMGVFIGSNAYADVTNNVITRTERGITLQTYSVAAPAGVHGPQITGNTISSSTSGIYYATGANGAAPTISSNTLNSLGATNGAIWLLNDLSATTVSANTINAGAALGYVVWTKSLGNAMTISGGSVTGASVAGILYTNDTATVTGSSEGSGQWAAVSSQLTVSGVTLTGNSTGIAIVDSALDTNAIKGVSLIVTGNSSISGGTTGILVSGAKASLAFSGTTAASLSGQSGDYITLASGAMGGASPGLIDATNVTFDHLGGGNTTTLSQYFAIEDKVIDAIDQSGLGVVRLETGNVFVTPASFNSPATSSASIQRGVDAASIDDNVNIEDGTYIGQVQIGTNLKLIGQTESGTILQASANMAVAFTTPSLNVPIVSVNGATNVSIESLTVDGNGQGNTNNRLEGIGFYRAGGLVQNVTVEHVRETPLNGDQHGVGIYALDDNNSTQSLTIETSNIFDYQKNGMALSGAGLTVNVSHNTVTGAGATPLNGQNGIQVGFGASGTIDSNTVSGNIYTGTEEVAAADILVFQTGAATSVTNNILSASDEGIATQQTVGLVTISGNTITTADAVGIAAYDGQFSISNNSVENGVGDNGADFNTGDGIDVFGDDNATTAIVTSNTIENNTGIGLLVDGAKAIAQSNTITGDNEGVVIADGSTVDLGTDASDSGHANFSGLGTSTGHNTLTGYTGTGGHYAIDDQNTVSGSQPNVLAEDNNFGPFSANDPSFIGTVIHDHSDDASLTTVFFQPALDQQTGPDTVYVKSSWVGTAPGMDVDGAGPGTAFGYDEFATIQDGINAVNINGTVDVHAGTYAQDLTISKTVHLVGAGAGQDAVARANAFVLGKADPSIESVITAPAIDPGAASGDLIHVSANGVTIDGFVLDGNNALLGSSSTVLGGVNIDARRGIETADVSGNLVAANGLVVENDIIQNVSQRGVEFANPTDTSPATSDNSITGNVIRNFGLAGAYLANNAYSDITNNTIVMGTGAEAGVEVQDFTTNGASPKTMNISGNNVSVTQDAFAGIWTNLIYPSALTLNIDHNTVNAAAGVTGTNGLTFGIYLSSLQNGVAATLNANTIGSTGGQFAAGISLWNLPASTPVSVARGSVGNSVVGILVDNNDVNFGAAGAGTTVGISGVTISGGAVVGILVNGDSGDGSVSANITGNNITTSSDGIDISGIATATISGNTIDAAAIGVYAADTAVVNIGDGTSDGSNQIEGDLQGISVQGSAHATINKNSIINTVASGGSGIQVLNSAVVSIDNNTFGSGANANGTDVEIDGGTISSLTGNAFAASTLYIDNESANSINATTDSFNVGVVGAPVAGGSLNVAQGFAVEDHMIDAIDQTGLGFVRLQDGSVFVTPHSYLDPEMSDTGSIQRAIDAAAAGDIVNIEAGTYTLSANITLSKSITLAGPNVGNSPVNGGPTRVGEAVINGGAPGSFTGSSGFVINLAAGITSLSVEGLSFTNFDGNVFASSLVPVTNVILEQDIFNANNGGLFFKFDDAVSTTFTVEDNRITNQSMTGANTALFFLGNVVNSHFDGNEVTNITSRELVNVFTALSNTTFSDNKLTNTAGLVSLFADQSGVKIDGNVITNTTTGGAAIYVGTNDGHTVSDLDISGNDITTDSGIGIKLAVDTAGAGSITGVTVENNTISGTGLYGLDLDTFAGNGTGTLSNITIQGNTFTNNAFGPILAYARVTSGTNVVSNLSINQNTFSENAGIFTSSFYLVDLRNVSGINSFSNNSFALSGTLPGGTDAIRDISIRGNKSGTFNITNNTFDGGGVTHNNAPTVFVTAIVVMSNDATTGALASTAVINISNNLINHFEDGIAVRDGVGAVYGNLPAGVQMNVTDNGISGNSLSALRTGSTGASVNATNNWWGSANGPTNPGNTFNVGLQGGTILGSDVSYAPWLSSGHNNATGPGFIPDANTSFAPVMDDAGGKFSSIRAAVNSGDGSQNITAAAGTFTENVLLNRVVNIAGAGDGSDASTNTIVQSAAANSPVLNITVGGASSLSELTISSLRFTGASGGSGNSNAGIEVGNGSANLGHYLFDDIASVNNTGAGITVNSSGAITDFNVTDSNLSGNGAQGLVITDSLSSLDGLTVMGGTINDNGFDGISVDPLGTPAGPRTNITVSGTTLSGNGNTASATPNQAAINLLYVNGNVTLSNLNITTATNTNSAYGIQLRGSSSGIAVGNVSITNVNISGNVVKAGLIFQVYQNLNNVTLSNDVINVAAGYGAVVVDHVGPNALQLGNTSITNSNLTAPTIAVWNTGGINATDATLDGVGPTDNTLADIYGVEDKIVDAIDVSGLGLVRLRAGNIYVTPNSYSAPTTTTPSIQRGVNAASANDTVNVEGGPTYHEDVTISTSGLKLKGSGAATTTISGVIGGSNSTIAVAANNVDISGFTITRDGNDVADWNLALNLIGVSINGAGLTGMTVHDNIITGNRNGVDINNSSGNTVRNNVITDNRTGMFFRNQTDNTTVTENFITNNWTDGILFDIGSTGPGAPLQQALNSHFFDNDISGNWYGQVVDRQTGGSLPAPGTTNLKDFSNNWFGTATPVVTTANSTEPGYAAQIPVEFDGTATAPGGQPDIAGPASANIQITPVLTDGTDTNVETTPGRGTFGFQGNLNNLGVTISGDATVYEGSEYTLNLNPTNPGSPAITSWDINWNDGSAIQHVDGDPTTVTHKFIDGPNSYSITATATTTSGTASSNSVAVAVANVSPTIAISGNSTVSEGSPYILNLGAVTDPGTDTVTSYIVHWGDETVSTYSTSGPQTHVYADGLNNYNITVDLVDEDGSYSNVANALSVGVSNVDPTLTLSGNSTVSEGSSYTLTLNSSDPGDDTISSWVVDWGDGSHQTVTAAARTGTGPFSTSTTATHDYVNGPNNYTISATASDEDGTYSAGNTVAVAVIDVTPTVALSGSKTDPANPSANDAEGSVFTLTIGPVVDPGAAGGDTVQEYDINWGDSTQTINASDLPANRMVTHTYVDGQSPAGTTTPTYTITVGILDNDGFHSTAGSLGVVVYNLPPTATFSGSSNINEGSTGSVLFFGQSDPSVSADPTVTTDTKAGFHYAYDFTYDPSHPTVKTFTVGADISGVASYGTGVTSASATVPASTTMTPGVHTILGRIIDKDGGFTDYTFQITVLNVAPVVNLPATASVGAGGLFTQAGTFTDPGNDGNWTGTVDYGDGTGVHALTVDSSTKSFTLNHTYTGVNPTGYTVTVMITDQPQSYQGQAPAASMTGTGTMNVAVTATTLQVTSFTPNASGFDVTFNRAIDLSTLHLYGSSLSGGFGTTSDLTVFDNVTHQNVLGSLIWDPTTDTAHWVKTGSPLSADSYTVTLVSGSNGFKDTADESLDGASNGGTQNYTNNFSISYSTTPIALSVPDFARGPGQSVIIPATPTGSGTGLPVQISNANGIFAVDFDVVYDTSVLSITSASLAPGIDTNHWHLAVNFLGGGRIRFTAFGDTPLATTAGAMNVVMLTASVNGSAAYAANAEVQIQNVAISNNSSAVPSIGDTAVEKVAFIGDADGDQGYFSPSATLISRVRVGLDSGFDAYALTDPYIIANIDGAATITGLDSSLVLQKSVGVDVPQIPAIPVGFTPAAGIGVDPNLSTLSDVLVSGGFASLPIAIDDATNILGVNFVISDADSDLNLSTFSYTSNGWSITSNLLADGLHVALTPDNNGLSTGPLTMGTLKFNVAAKSNPDVDSIILTGPASYGVGNPKPTFTYTNGSIDIPPSFTGSSGDDQYTVRIDGTDPSMIDIIEQLSGGSPTTYTFAKSLLTNPNFNVFTFQTLGGNDTLTVDYANGNPLPAGGISFDGGSESDSFVIDAPTTQNNQFNVNASGVSYIGGDPFSLTNEEQIVINGGAGNDTVTQTATSPVAYIFNGGTGNDTLNIQGGSYTFATDAVIGTQNLSVNVTNTGSQVTFDGTQHLAGLSIGDGTFAQVALAPAAARGVLVTGGLSIAGTGQLDLTDNDMVVLNTPTGDVNTPGTIAYELKTGLNASGGYWNGLGGIVSSAARNDTTFLTTLGYRSGNGGTFDGVATSSSDTEVKYTYYGDADLNGAVDGGDYQQIDTGFGTGGSGWSNGDFNYDGSIDGSDFTLIDNSFNQLMAASAISSPTNTPASTVMTASAVTTSPTLAAGHSASTPIAATGALPTVAIGNAAIAITTKAATAKPLAISSKKAVTVHVNGQTHTSRKKNSSDNGLAGFGSISGLDE